MTTMVSELYTALKAAGIEDEMARAAARSVIAIEDKDALATKADLTELRLAMKADIADLKADVQKSLSDLTWKMVGLMVGMTAIFSGLSAMLRFVR